MMKPNLGLCGLFLAMGIAAQAGDTHYALRGYREFTGSDRVVGLQKSAVEVRTFVFETPERASGFASKIYSE